MIRYQLKCAEGHQFDSWFQSADAFEALKASGHLACAVCGGSSVEKALMAPAVTPEATAPKPTRKEGPLSTPRSVAEQAMAELRRKVEANSEYVGNNFAKEARAMHEGASPERAIYGEARVDEARKLVEDGVPVVPLPFTPKSRTN